jgi:hypothetical protein
MILLTLPGFGITINLKTRHLRDIRNTKSVFFTSTITVRQSLRLFWKTVKTVSAVLLVIFDNKPKTTKRNPRAFGGGFCCEHTQIARRSPSGERIPNCQDRTDRHAQVSVGGVMILLTLPGFGLIDGRPRWTA